VEALIKTVQYIKEFVRVPVIVDAKRADVAHSSMAYAKYVYEIVGGDAVTVSPYMGLDAIRPFVERRTKGVFVLCKTSNAGAAEIQNLSCAEPLYHVIANKVLEWNVYGNLGLVVGATQEDELHTVRRLVGQDVPLLIPGVGSQGGDLQKAVTSGMNANGRLGIIAVSRDVILAKSPHKMAAEFRNSINAFRSRD
jgi:orotidine-5'-phosphate decarboxylase